MKKKKPRKPDAAQRACGRFLNTHKRTASTRTQASLAFGFLAGYRRAINAAEKRGEQAERKRIERYIRERIIRTSPGSEAHAVLASVLSDIDHGSKP
jgi:hypothetical protein